MQKMKLTDDVFRTFKVAKVFRENTDQINCLDFSSNGENMIASSNDDSIVVYCCVEGRWAKIGIGALNRMYGRVIVDVAIVIC